ncbi:MAG: phage holin family protein [Allosphingosinicella sp.]
MPENPGRQRRLTESGAEIEPRNPENSPHADPRLVPLLRRLGSDGSGLIRQEIALAGIELRSSAVTVAKQSALLILGGILILIGLLMLIEFAVLALGRLLGNYWLSSLIVGGVFTLGGIALIVWGRRALGLAQALIGNPELIIVDEPTAGLDPEERNRFLNLLAEIGENVVVILSTHIVEDVSDLCPRMAVLANGRIQLEGAPLELIHSTKGRIWMKVIERGDLERYREKHELISTRLFAGRTVIHVLADADPGDGFASVEGGLEEVYFSTLAQSRRAA